MKSFKNHAYFLNNKKNLFIYDRVHFVIRHVHSILLASIYLISKT